MLLTVMRAKLHRATVTQADLDYEGSIAIDKDLLDASTLLPHEQVDVFNITTGARFTTYVIEAPRGSRTVGVNGAAARLATGQVPPLVLVTLRWAIVCATLALILTPEQRGELRQLARRQGLPIASALGGGYGLDAMEVSARHVASILALGEVLTGRP